MRQWSVDKDHPRFHINFSASKNLPPFTTTPLTMIFCLNLLKREYLLYYGYNMCTAIFIRHMHNQNVLTNS